MKPRPGHALASPVDSTTVIVVRAPDRDVDITCAGVGMWDPKGGGEPPAGTTDPGQLTGSVMGKRYASQELGLELLCTKAGEGSISVGETVLAVKGAKPLPASD